MKTKLILGKLQVFSFTGFIAMNSVDFYNPKMQVAVRVEAC